MKAIIENEGIIFSNLISFFFILLKKYLKLFIVILFFYTGYYFVKSPATSSSVSFYTNYNAQSSQNFLLREISALGGFSIDENPLNFSISNYLSSERLITETLEKEYSFGDKKDTLVNFLGKKYNRLFSLNPLKTVKQLDLKLSYSKKLTEYEKKLLFASNKLKENLIYDENKMTGLHKITVIVENDEFPALPQQIVDQIYSSIISYISDITSIKSKEKITFIENRIIQAKSLLDDSEEKLLKFRETNVSRNSPTLMLQAERLERDILIYTNIYMSLSGQLEIANIDEKDNTSSIFILDSSKKSNLRYGRSLFTNLAILSLLLFFVLFSYEAYHKRKELFR